MAIVSMVVGARFDQIGDPIVDRQTVHRLGLVQSKFVAAAVAGCLVASLEFRQGWSTFVAVVGVPVPQLQTDFGLPRMEFALVVGLSKAFVVGLFGASSMPNPSQSVLVVMVVVEIVVVLRLLLPLQRPIGLSMAPTQ